MALALGGHQGQTEFGEIAWLLRYVRKVDGIPELYGSLRRRSIPVARTPTARRNHHGSGRPQADCRDCPGASSRS
jgi:hypothetical protein